MARDGFSDCFGDKAHAIDFAQKLIIAASKSGPSDTEVCYGKSPFGDEVPYPWCVNQRWNVPKGHEYDSEISQKWDEWRVKHRVDIGDSEDLYAGPERVEEFDDTFYLQECKNVKLGEVI